MKNSNKKKLCIIGTVYGLFLYLASHTHEEIDNTLFILKKGLVKNPSALKHKIIINNKNKLYNISIFNYIVFRIFFRLFLFVFRSFNRLYAQDHLLFSSFILGSKEYILIEDAPHSIDLYSQTSLYEEKMRFLRRPAWQKKWRYFWKGYAYDMPHGLSEKAVAVLAYSDDKKIYHQMGKPVYNVSKNIALGKIDERAKEMILHVFGIEHSLFEKCADKDIAIFTQPLCVDRLVSEQEHSRIYTLMINHYPNNRILLKVHPRDTFRYKDISNEIMIIRETFPSQLFDLFNVRFKIVATVFSTSVLSISYPVKIDWWGTKVSDELYEKLGDIKLPKK